MDTCRLTVTPATRTDTGRSHRPAVAHDHEHVTRTKGRTLQCSEANCKSVAAVLPCKCSTVLPRFAENGRSHAIGILGMAAFMNAESLMQIQLLFRHYYYTQSQAITILFSLVNFATGIFRSGQLAEHSPLNCIQLHRRCANCSALCDSRTAELDSGYSLS